MNYISTLFSLFNTSTDNLKVAEYFNSVEASLMSDQLSFPTADLLAINIAFVKEPDECTLSVKIGAGDPHQYRPKYDDAKIFLAAAVSDYKDKDDEDKVTIVLKIFKFENLDSLVIYSLPAFDSYITTLTIEETIKFFSDRIDIHGLVRLSLLEEGIFSQSGSILISSIRETRAPNQMPKERRQKRLESIRSVSSSNVLATYIILPEDFDFEGSIPLAPNLFQRLKILHQNLLLASLFDTSTISENKFSGKLVGYKALRFELDSLDASFTSSIDDLNNIYTWIFTSGSVVDKLGLARNIISLHVSGEGKFELISDSWQAILSSYKIYEKQNIKQYIEVRNKLFDQLLDYNKRATLVIDSFASAFQKSALAVLTLFATIIAARFLSNVGPSTQFLFFSTALATVFLGISALYMVISIWEVITQKKRLKNSYINFKLRQTDLLSEGDIERILNNDKDFNDDVKFVHKKLLSYSALWIIILISLTALLGYYIHLNKNSPDEKNLIVIFLLDLIM